MQRRREKNAQYRKYKLNKVQNTEITKFRKIKIQKLQHKENKNYRTYKIQKKYQNHRIYQRHKI